MHGAKIMVYGKAGTGKTRLLASAPSPIILSAEQGLLSLRGFNLPVWQIKTIQDLVEAYMAILKDPKFKQFKSVGIDSTSEIAEVLLNAEMKKTTNGQRAYGETQNKMTEIFRNFRDIPGLNVIFLAKEEFTTDAASGAKAYGPSFPGGKLSQQAPYLVDELFQLVNFGKNAEGVEQRFLRTQPDNQHQAKDRSGALAEWENACPETGGGLTTIFNKMIG